MPVVGNYEPMSPADSRGPAPVPFLINNDARGVLQFEMNPTVYDPYPERNYQSVPVASGYNLVQTPLFDNTKKTMQFAELTNNFYQSLKRYANVTSSGTRGQCLFTDGTFGGYTNAGIKVLRVHGVPATSSTSGMIWRDVRLEFVDDTAGQFNTEPGTS